MEKNIELTMSADKAVRIFINGELKHTINKEDRSISADKIYELIGFSIDDHYTVASENPAKVDEPVLKFFYELFDEIISRINSLKDDPYPEIINFNENTQADSSDFTDDIPF